MRRLTRQNRTPLTRSRLATRFTTRFATKCGASLVAGGLTVAVGLATAAQPAGAQTDVTTTTVVAQPTTPAPPSEVSTSAPATSPGSTSPALSTAATTTTPTTVVPATTVVPPSTPTTAPVPSSAPTTKPTPVTTQPTGTVIPPGKVLKVGSKGPDVLALEQRLAELMIDTGKVDGRFDWSTWQGVVAFQKYWGLKRTGKVDNELRLTIQKSAGLSGFIFRGPGTRLEVDKSKQLLFMYEDNVLWRVVSVSTGSGKKYCEYSKKAQRQVCGTANTPTGRFKIQRRISGWRESDLGRLYNPLYFNGGIAFHGAPSVPAYPASHGCVRLPMPISEWFPDKVDNGTAVYVYD